MFCDVTGSTELGERLDPESMRKVLARYFEAMRAALERHGGSVEKFIGDAVMAVFGIPQLHEDDALRAVRAAADMRRRSTTSTTSSSTTTASAWHAGSASTPARCSWAPRPPTSAASRAMP